MRLAGEANWWAPPALRRFHNRFGISEGIELEEAPKPALVNGRPRRERQLVAAGREPH